MGMYRNYRCRVCGALISKYYSSSKPMVNAPGLLISKKYHVTCPDLEEGESALCDFISISERPLSRAAEVYHSDMIF